MRVHAYQPDIILGRGNGRPENVAATENRELVQTSPFRHSQERFWHSHIKHDTNVLLPHPEAALLITTLRYLTKQTERKVIPMTMLSREEHSRNRIPTRDPTCTHPQGQVLHTLQPNSTNSEFNQSKTVGILLLRLGFDRNRKFLSSLIRLGLN